MVFYKPVTVFTATSLMNDERDTRLIAMDVNFFEIY